MGSKYDIAITMKLIDEEDKFNSQYLIDGLRLLENALYKSDIKDIDRVCSRLNLSEIVKDASRERLRRFRNKRIRIYKVEKNSITISALVLATAYCVIHNTIGESMKESFKGTDMDNNIKNLLRLDISKKVRDIVKYITQGVEKKKYKATDINFDNIDPNSIRVEIKRVSYGAQEEVVGTLNEELNQEEYHGGD